MALDGGPLYSRQPRNRASARPRGADGHVKLIRGLDYPTTVVVLTPPASFQAVTAGHSSTFACTGAIES